ncbi:MAG: fibronectin type III domain-containing protein, partial [candidate division KSB1 bacterium]|nr:fibronectin type III domain-containing protein [candidate division KSB1 bacterium]
MMLRKKIGSIFLLLFGIYSHVVAGTGSLIVSWDPNKEADLKGYKIYYGTATRNYSSIVDVGNIISHTVNNLSEGVTYFFAVTAYDTAGNESDFSVEVSATVARSDVTPPTISSVEILSADRVNVAFSEPVEQASAENKANYKIDQGVEVLGATLDANLKVVHLTTTAHQRGQTYTITINNIQDRASPPNTIASNSSFSYYFELIDSTPPSISSVIILNETAVDVTFSEAVDKESAETEANYHIDKLVKVLYAILDDNLKLVHLITTSHQRGQTYTITINNIKDRAPTPNVIPANSSYSYYFDLIDIIPPTISSVTIRDENHLDVTFSEEVEQASAENKNNYRIDKGIEIQNVVLDANLKVVHLTTTTHQRGETYTISISNVRDRAPSPNTIAANSSYSYFLPTLDTTPPTIAAVEILEETRLDVTFSKQLERSSAEDKSNYSINKGIEVLKAILDNNLRIVHLTTSTHKRGELYTIVINNVRDRAPSPNTIAPNSSYTYYLEVVDTTPPTISSVAILNETRVDVTFSEKVDLETAQVSSNYRIDKGIKVKDAILDANHKVVHLSTSEHQRGETYTLTVNNVRDQAPSPNTIAANSSYSYYFELIDLTAPTITSVNILDETTVRVVFSEPVESASAETKTNYKIDTGIQGLLARQDTNASVVSLTSPSPQRGETY